MDSDHRRHRRALSNPRIMPTVIQPTPIARSSSTRHASSSSPDHMSQSPNARPPRTASRIMISMKRSLTPSSSKSRHHDSASPTSRGAMYSTPEERMSPQQHQPSHFLNTDPLLSRPAPPTIEQIAMGLHVSRTPHLRPLASSRYPYSRGNNSALPHSHNSHHTPIVLPPPPSRSSLKKPSGSPTKHSASASSESTHQFMTAYAGSSTTVTSVTTPSSSATSSLRHPGAFSFTKFRMGRFLTGSRSSSAPSSSVLSTPVSSPRHSTGEFEVVQKKAVRFEGADDGED